MTVDPEREITVCCGSTEAMISSMMAIINPGDEVVIFEPFYENYGPDAILSGATPRFVRLHPPDWSFDREELANAFGPNTKAIIVNTPNNPTGKVFTREELEFIRDLCVRWNTFAITDEIYEHIIYDGAGTSPWPRSRACATAPSPSTACPRPTASPDGASAGPSLRPMPPNPFARCTIFSPSARRRRCRPPAPSRCSLPRDLLPAPRRNLSRQARPHARHSRTTRDSSVSSPRGAYYIMTDISRFGFPDDVAFARYLVEKIGIAAVPGSSFYNDAADGARQVRFTFCKKEETLSAAAERLSRLRPS